MLTTGRLALSSPMMVLSLTMLLRRMNFPVDELRSTTGWLMPVSPSDCEPCMSKPSTKVVLEYVAWVFLSPLMMVRPGSVVGWTAIPSRSSTSFLSKASSLPLSSIHASLTFVNAEPSLLTGLVRIRVLRSDMAV